CAVADECAAVLHAAQPGRGPDRCRSTIGGSAVNAVPVTLNGLRFNGPAVDGVEWTVDTPVGLGGAGVRVATGGRVQQDGAWSTKAYRTSKAMGLTGMCEYRSAGNIPGLVAELERAVSVDPVPVTVHWPSGDQTRLVRRDGGVDPDVMTDRFFTWSCTVVADDPHWYRGGPGGPIAPGFPVPPADGWQIVQTGLPSSTGGLEFPFSFPFEFSDVTVSGDVTVATERGGWWVLVVTNQQSVVDLVNPRVIVNYPDGSI